LTWLDVLEPRDWDGPVLRLANAGQVPPLLCRHGLICDLVPDGEWLALGVVASPRNQHLVVELVPGEVVVLSSDGLPEAPYQSTANGTLGELFGFEQLVTSAASWAAKSHDADAVADGIWSDVTEWGGGDDDMTLVVLRVQPRP
jgi:serine phosphatase RsbU (regulator of sigma subunit)